MNRRCDGSRTWHSLRIGRLRSVIPRTPRGGVSIPPPRYFHTCRLTVSRVPSKQHPNRPEVDAHERSQDTGGPPRRPAYGGRSGPGGCLSRELRTGRNHAAPGPYGAERRGHLRHPGRHPRQPRTAECREGPRRRTPGRRPAALPRTKPAEIEHGPRNRPRVALTFHGQGDPALARAVLGAAERAGARLTVLAVGSWLDQNPGMARRILDGGHDLGNHTQSHLDINTMDETRAYEEIDGCARRLQPAHRLDRHLVQTLARPARHPARPGPRAPGRIPARALLRRGLPRLHLTRGRGRHP